MERITRMRMNIMLLIVGLVLGFFALRIYDLQIIQTGGIAARDNTTTFTTMTRVKAARGEILDRNGNVLVGNRATYDLIIVNYVLESSPQRNQYLLQLVELCNDMGETYNEHFPMTFQRPFEYTLTEFNTTWQSYFQRFLSERGIDSDVTAPLLLEKLRNYYNIPEEWSDEQARAVIGIRYELSLRGLTTEPTYVFMDDASDEARSAILELNVPGLNVESSVVREYHTAYAAHILGYTSKMTPAQWETYKATGEYTMDAEVGQSGLELAMEQYLHGIDGWRIDTYTADGTVIASEYQSYPKAGSNVEITIDINLQKTVEDALASCINELRNQGAGHDGTDVEGGAAVVMDVQTGQVLACASNPTFDLANLSEKWDETLAIPYNAMYNRALDATYPPGSTYKMCTTIAAMDSNISIDGQVFTADTEIRDMGVFNKYEGFNLYCLVYSSNKYTHGSINVVTALTVSCNYFFAVLGDNVRLSVMDRTAKGLGLGEPTGVELPEEIGHRANEETKKMLYGEDAGFYQGDQIQSAIGQSDNSFSPMQLCVYAATLARKGIRPKATFLNRVVSSDYQELLLENTPEIMNTMEISSNAYLAYGAGMNGVITSPAGTAREQFNGHSFYLNGEEIQIAGKTGTAESGRGGSDNGAFICYAPYTNNPDDAKVAISIYIEKGGHGNVISAVARDILDVYFANTSTTSDMVTYENRPS